MRHVKAGMLIVGSFMLFGCDGSTDFSEEAGLGAVQSALTLEQCLFFQQDSKITVCHETSSAKNPWVIVRINQMGCGGHENHATDWIDTTDACAANVKMCCQEKGCFPDGAPYDGSVPCCEGLDVVDGHCFDRCLDRDTLLPKVCDDYNPCTVEACDWATGECVVANVAEGVSCGSDAADGCDAPDACDGAGNCVDHVKAAGAVCLAGQLPCDPDDVCDGATKACMPLLDNDYVEYCPYGGPEGTESVGMCKAGTRTCNEGVLGACEGEVLPIPEICGDTEDNNCNGIIDCGIGLEQWGSKGTDQAHDVVIDATGNAFVSGMAMASIDQQPFKGHIDVFLSKFDVNGNRLWTKMWGTAGEDVGHGIALADDGSIYVCGYTSSQASNAAYRNILLLKFGASGELIWTKIISTMGTYQDIGWHVRLDPQGDLFVAATTVGGRMAGTTSYGGYDQILLKFDSDGNQLLARQFGTSATDAVYGLVVDQDGNAYVGGNTLGRMAGTNPSGQYDYVVTKWDNDGNRLWTSQWGTPKQHEWGYALGIDGYGNPILAGSRTDGANGGGASVIQTFKLSPTDGAILWGADLNSPGDPDLARHVTGDAYGNVYVTGQAAGLLPDSNEPWQGSLDVFLVKYDKDGVHQWTTMRGTPKADAGGSVAVSQVDEDNRVTVVGWENSDAAQNGDLFLWSVCAE